MNALTNMGRGLCSGRWDLFDSTDPTDHAQAKALCTSCPVLSACFDALTEARQVNGNAAPVGTWAGQLLDGSEKHHAAAYKAWRAAS